MDRRSWTPGPLIPAPVPGLLHLGVCKAHACLPPVSVPPRRQNPHKPLNPRLRTLVWKPGEVYGSGKAYKTALQCADARTAPHTSPIGELVQESKGSLLVRLHQGGPLPAPHPLPWVPLKPGRGERPRPGVRPLALAHPSSAMEPKTLRVVSPGLLMGDSRLTPPSHRTVHATLRGQRRNGQPGEEGRGLRALLGQWLAQSGHEQRPLLQPASAS